MVTTFFVVRFCATFILPAALRAFGRLRNAARCAAANAALAHSANSSESSNRRAGNCQYEFTVTVLVLRLILKRLRTLRFELRNGLVVGAEIKPGAQREREIGAVGGNAESGKHLANGDRAEVRKQVDQEIAVHRGSPPSTSLMVRRRSSAVSNHESPECRHPSRRRSTRLLRMRSVAVAKPSRRSVAPTRRSRRPRPGSDC